MKSKIKAPTDMKMSPITEKVYRHPIAVIANVVSELRDPPIAAPIAYIANGVVLFETGK